MDSCQVIGQALACKPPVTPQRPRRPTSSSTAGTVSSSLRRQPRAPGRSHPASRGPGVLGTMRLEATTRRQRAARPPRKRHGQRIFHTHSNVSATRRRRMRAHSTSRERAPDAPRNRHLDRVGSRSRSRPAASPSRCSCSQFRSRWVQLNVFLDSSATVLRYSAS